MRRFLGVALIGVTLALAGCTFGPTTRPVITPSATPITDDDVTPSPPDGQPGQLSPEQVERISRATVQVYSARRGTSGDLQPIASASGVLLSANGQIVSSCRVVCGAPAIVVLLTGDTNQPPEALYQAEVTAFDEGLDLALLQINQNIVGNPVSASSLSLPFLERGDSGALRAGQAIRIFGYPSTIGSARVTSIDGMVTGFETAQINGVEQRRYVKTDANVDNGTSGGAVVDTSGRLVAVPTTVSSSEGGGALGTIGLLVPVNLLAGLGEGAPPTDDGSKTPPELERDEFEPNNNFQEASGPLTPGQSLQGYISWDDDVDVFYLDAGTTSTVSVALTGVPAGVDYDVYVYSGGNVVASSDNETGQDELAEFRPAAPGRFHVAVSSFRGSNAEQPYTLNVKFDGSQTGGGGGGGPAVSVTGVVINGNTGRPFERGLFGVLNDGVTCDQFFTGGSLNMGLVSGTGVTDSNGRFSLAGVPSGQRYSAFFVFGNDKVCQNNWLNVGSGNVDLGVITLAF